MDSVMVVRGNEAIGDVPGVFRLALLDGAVVLRAKDETEAELWVAKLEEMQQARIDQMMNQLGTESELEAEDDAAAR